MQLLKYRARNGSSHKYRGRVLSFLCCNTVRKMQYTMEYRTENGDSHKFRGGFDVSKSLKFLRAFLSKKKGDWIFFYRVVTRQ